MALAIDVFKERLRDTFCSDSQETVGRKLNMTQGNVSKLLSGAQQPTLDTLNRIAEVYGVSVDWLMGLSDRRHPLKPTVGIPYALAVEVVTDLIHHGAKLLDDKGHGAMSIVLEDPILNKLIRKSHTLSRTDWDLFQDWKSTRLSMFDDKELLYTSTFTDDGVGFLAGEASSESNLLEVYEAGKRFEDDYAAMMDDPGPFKD